MTRILHAAKFLARWQWVGWSAWAVAVAFLAPPLAALPWAFCAGLSLADFLLAAHKRQLAKQLEDLQGREAQLLVAIGCASSSQRVAVEIAEQQAGLRAQ